MPLLLSRRWPESAPLLFRAATLAAMALAGLVAVSALSEAISAWTLSDRADQRAFLTLL